MRLTDGGKTETVSFQDATGAWVEMIRIEATRASKNQ